MQKLQKRKWETVALCILLIVAVLFAFSLFVPITQELCGKNYYTNAKECPAYHVGPYLLTALIRVIDEHNGLVAALAGVAIALFTYTLRNASVGQLTELRRSVDVLLTTERGYPYPVITNPGAINEVLAADEDQGTEVSFHIKNFGKTPIVLNLITTGCGTKKTIGRNSEWLSIDDPILGVGEHTRPLTREFSPQLEGAPKALIGLSLNPIFFEGRIIYSDIWDNEFQTWFRFVWETEPDRGRWRLSGLKIEEYDSEKEWDEFLKS